MRTSSGKLLSVHLTGEEHETLHRAAKHVDLDIKSFVVQAALEKAGVVVEGDGTLILTRRESLRLLRLLDNPPPRNEKFLQAQARYNRLKAMEI